MRRTQAFSLVLLVAALGLSGCSGMSRQQQRTLSGGAIGAGAGALIAGVTGGSVLAGAVIGGAGGAVVGAVTH